MKKIKGYLASHFFNAAMFDWTEKLANRIEKETGIELYVPQRNDSITKELKESNLLIACLDGLTIDDGVSGEIMAFGVMKELEEEYNLNKDFKRMIIGIITDMRYLGTGENKLYRNLMIVGKVKEHGHLVVGYPTNDDYIDEVINIIKEFIK